MQPMHRWAWFNRLVLWLWVTRRPVVPWERPTYYAWPVFVRAAFRRHHKVREVTHG